ncbi:MAG: hypothetical protein DRJ42_08700 [Deltaproteobacteria bacterium]|nr:MAG: hypothetical protein DRJ42_08700 [Deltaproteobacteria bacterium]
MSLVLIVEDEAMLRASLARGLSKMDGIDVVDAGSVDDALVLIDRRPPDLIISDIDMPGRTGIELLGELGRRGLIVPIVYVSAYLKAYRAQLPPNANIEVMEKPVALHEIREMVRTKLERRSEAPEPFSVPDFIQLASMGRRSVVIEATWPDGSKGEISVRDGEVWDASAGDRSPKEAFARVAWSDDARVRCRTARNLPAVRRLEGSAESLLMDTARLLDESNREGLVDRAQRYSSMPPRMGGDDLEDAFAAAAGPAEGLSSIDADDTKRAFAEEDDEAAPEPPVELSPMQKEFNRLVDDGVMALLTKDFATAAAAFQEAEEIQPGDSTVRTNIERLRELGHVPEPKGESS